MIKIAAASLFIILNIHSADAQYYYKDIVSSRLAGIDMATYKANKVRTVKLKSFEDDGSISDGFFGERRISKDYRKSELFVRSNVSGTSLLTTLYNPKGQVSHSTDSSDIATTRTTYYYDDQDRIKKITTSLRSSDDDFLNEIFEEHIYIYEDEFLPAKMIRVKNRYDSITILFLHDENNNISLEKDTRTGSKYYYYYDEKSRLTDIAHSNEFKPRLLADYLFEYNPAGLMTQMTTTEEGGNNYYYIWKYTYVEGMRTIEKLYSKEKRLMGSIQYEYN